MAKKEYSVTPEQIYNLEMFFKLAPELPTDPVKMYEGSYVHTPKTFVDGHLGFIKLAPNKAYTEPYYERLKHYANIVHAWLKDKGITVVIPPYVTPVEVIKEPETKPNNITVQYQAGEQKTISKESQATASPEISKPITVVVENKPKQDKPEPPAQPTLF